MLKVCSSGTDRGLRIFFWKLYKINGGPFWNIFPTWRFGVGGREIFLRNLHLSLRAVLTTGTCFLNIKLISTQTESFFHPPLICPYILRIRPARSSFVFPRWRSTLQRPTYSEWTPFNNWRCRLTSIGQTRNSSSSSNSFLSSTSAEISLHPRHFLYCVILWFVWHTDMYKRLKTLLQYMFYIMDATKIRLVSQKPKRPRFV